MNTVETIATAATAAILAIGNYVASRKGGKEGSAGALNGTAVAVREIKELAIRIDTKLDGHVSQTAENFRELSDRTSTIEGRLADAEPPKRVMRASRRKAS